MAFVIIHQQHFAQDFSENFAHSAVRNKVDYYYWKFLLVSVTIYAINCAKDKNPLSCSQIRTCSCESSHCKGDFFAEKNCSAEILVFKLLEKYRKRIYLFSKVKIS